MLSYPCTYKMTAGEVFSNVPFALNFVTRLVCAVVCEKMTLSFHYFVINEQVFSLFCENRTFLNPPQQQKVAMVNVLILKVCL